MKSLSRFAFAGCLCALAGCSATPEANPSPASLEVSFELADGSQVDEVAYSVTGNGITPIEGTIDTRARRARGELHVGHGTTERRRDAIALGLNATQRRSFAR
ncbi:MAG: hypothetical protein WBG86_02615 [Polyangiales bacterium]